jgi:hypothetical protein
MTRAPVFERKPLGQKYRIQFRLELLSTTGRFVYEWNGGQVTRASQSRGVGFEAESM